MSKLLAIALVLLVAGCSMPNQQCRGNSGICHPIYRCQVESADGKEAVVISGIKNWCPTGSVPQKGK